MQHPKQKLNPNQPVNVSKKFIRPFARKARVKPAIPARMVAYDFETTRIEAGTPRPLYITAFGLKPECFVECAIDNMQHLHSILENQFLTPELDGVKFVAWNANNFDAYFVASALVTDPKYTIRPYLTNNGSLRGMRIMITEFIDDAGDYPKTAPSWEFLDGMAMLGFAGLSLEKFLQNFAPEKAKLTGVIDWDKEGFNAKNPLHREYAMRDSEGLYYGMVAAQNILIDKFNQGLAVTMGGICIKIFQAHIDSSVRVFAPPEALETVIRTHAMRGGYCYCVKRYQGPVWKYDLNQAYAAAMREAKLPQGQAFHTPRGVHKYASIYIARVTGTNPANKIPFYYRTEINGRMKPQFSGTEIYDTWITSIEVDQLRCEGWQINVIESWCFPSHFNMREYVDKLEVLRMTCEGGPSGPIGTMVKGVGNHSYGKTVESLTPINYLLCAETPPGYLPYYLDGDVNPLEHIFYQFIAPEDVREKEYHQPQLGAFITAYVRMVVRRAALLNPDAWLYADTDCVVFSEDMTSQLDTDAKRYGAWKIEEQGTEFQIIAKKVYINRVTGKGSAKGMNVRRLTPADFDQWFHGKPPVQEQTQRNSFLSVMRGAEMFRTQSRSGTGVS